MHGVKMQPGVQYLDYEHLASLRDDEADTGLRLPPISPRGPWIGTGRNTDSL